MHLFERTKSIKTNMKVKEVNSFRLDRAFKEERNSLLIKVQISFQHPEVWTANLVV